MVEMLRQQPAAQRLDDPRIPERRIHLGIAVHRVPVEIAGADRRPGVVDQHGFAVDIDIAAPGAGVGRGDSGQREILVTTERSQLREELVPLGIAPAYADMMLGIGRHERHHRDAALQHSFDPCRDDRRRNGLVLDVDRSAGRIDRLAILLEDRPLAGGDVTGFAAGRRMAVAVKTRMEIALDLNRRFALRPREAPREGQDILSGVTP